MGNVNPWWIGGLLGLVLGVFAIRWLWFLVHGIHVERARELFRLQHERFEELLVKAANETGKPRGLRWIGCEIIGDALLVREAASKAIVALVPVVIHFEPVEGSDMEGVPAAREPRTATAVYTYAKGHWNSDGRVVFNLDPQQTVAHFGTQYREIGHHH